MRTTSKFGRGLLLGMICFFVLVLLVLGGVIYGGYRVTVSDRNLPNLELDGIAVGGLTKAETVAKLRSEGWDSLTRVPLEVDLPLGIILKLDRIQAGAATTAENAAEELYRYGHSLKWLENLDKYLNARFSRTGVTPEVLNVELDENYLRANARAAVQTFADLTSDTELHIDRDEGTLFFLRSGGSVYLDEDRLMLAMEDALRRGLETLAYTEVSGDEAAPDFNALYEELATEPKDAYFSRETFEIVPEVIGCSFDPEEALHLWQGAAPGASVMIPLMITEPAVTEEYLNSLLYRDRLCFMTTNFWGSSSARINNIDLAACALDGLVLMPGETFSYNAAVGQRTEEAGFLLAGAYADGEVVEEVGGGICQVSSTLYCAAMYAQMTTVSRTNHYFAVSYLSMGYDATVSWQQPDYKFRNDRDFPVKILTYVDDHSVTVEFWGTNVDGSHVSPYTTSWEIYDEEYPTVLTGYGVITHRRILDANDNLLYTIDEPTGIYHLHDEEIQWPASRAATARLGVSTVASVTAAQDEIVWDPAILAILPD